MKFGNVCYFSIYSESMLTVDIALGIHEITRGNDITSADNDDVLEHVILLEEGRPITKNEENELRPEVKDRCKESTLMKVSERDVTKVMGDALRKGEIVFLTSSLSSLCDLKVV